MQDFKQKASAVLVERRGLLNEYAEKEAAFVMRLVDIVKEAQTELEAAKKREAKLREVLENLCSDYDAYATNGDEDSLIAAQQALQEDK